jgi:menaquinone-9 beta-reductase
MTSPGAIVVGGGPAGSSTAFFLARAGIDVTLIDRAHFPRDKPCAEYLSPQASRILSEMDALAELEEGGVAQLRGMIVRAPSGERIRGDFAAAHGFKGFRDRGIAVRRSRLDALLLDRARAAGAKVVEGERVIDVLRDESGRVNGVRTCNANGVVSERSCGMLVGADGLRSVIARRTGLSRHLPWPRRIAIVTHYHGVAGLEERGEMHVDASGYIGLADVGDGVTNVAVVFPAARAKEMGADPAGYIEKWIAERPHLAPRFRHALRVTPAAVTGPFASAVKRAWLPGVALVGDAAEFFDPFTGEGMYAALRGGELLAPFVGRALSAPTPEAANAELAGYERARRAEFSGKWAVERMVGMAVGFPFLLNRAARVLSRRSDMADIFVGVAGDFVPAREVFRPRYLLALLFPEMMAGSLSPRMHR